MTDQWTLKARIEAGLATVGRRISIDELCSFLETAREDVEEALKELEQDLMSMDRAWRVVRSHGKLRMEIKAPYADEARRFRLAKLSAREPRPLTPAAADVLAMIACKQGITLPEINRVREGDSSSIVEGLRRRKLIKSLKSEEGSRARRWATTVLFLEQYDLDSPDQVRKAASARVSAAEQATGV